jgi:HNH endonuclease/AP2 domain
MVTQKELKRLFHLDLATGILYWQVYGPGIKFGQPAGNLQKSTGYWRICLDGRRYRRGRLVFFYVYGFFPPEIDHINGDKADDRPDNLRPATRAQNQQNRPGRGKTLPKGVWKDSRYRKPFEAKITINGKRIRLGRFATADEAHAAYCVAANSYFGAFANCGSAAV